MNKILSVSVAIMLCINSGVNGQKIQTIGEEYENYFHTYYNSEKFIVANNEIKTMYAKLKSPKSVMIDGYYYATLVSENIPYNAKVKTYVKKNILRTVELTLPLEPFSKENLFHKTSSKINRGKTFVLLNNKYYEVYFMDFLLNEDDTRIK